MAWACGIQSTSDGMYKAGDVPISGNKSWNEIHFATPHPNPTKLRYWGSGGRVLLVD